MHARTKAGASIRYFPGIFAARVDHTVYFVYYYIINVT